jgi:hypothetical protein
VGKVGVAALTATNLRTKETEMKSKTKTKIN